MKLFAIVAAVILESFCPARMAAEPQEAAQPPAVHNSFNLDRLNSEYDRRRAAVLRPVVFWYREQLEALGRKNEHEGRAVADAKAKLAHTFWQDDQPELKQALLLRGWIWRSEMDAKGVEVTFSRDGSIHHVGLNGTWMISGPSEVTVRPTDDDAFVLRFNSSLTMFEGNRREVRGERLVTKH